MGQEIDAIQFSDDDFVKFHQQLSIETDLLKQIIQNNQCSNDRYVAGIELEAWLIDAALKPAPVNDLFLQRLQQPLASPELAKFNFELNTDPQSLSGDVFQCLHQQLQACWTDAIDCADQLNCSPLLIGILPTLSQSDLCLQNMSNLNRYKALNEQILFTRGKDVHVDITGVEHLKFDQKNVMLESAATSLQLHIQIPIDVAHHYYNASIIASAFVVAFAANSPYLFGKQLWHESRIPLFEQSIETGGYDGAANGPVKRVSFGTDYAHHSIFECFAENLVHFPILLPTHLDADPEQFEHLRLHNGTIWRWNRPIVGFNDDGTPHIRIEHRSPAAGPTIADAMTNAAFYYGLTHYLAAQLIAGNTLIPFSQAKDNFYQAAKHGLDAHIVWLNDQHIRIHHLIKTSLLEMAIAGLRDLKIDEQTISTYSTMIENRIFTKQTGSAWQLKFMQNNNADMAEMTKAYFFHQQQGMPVSSWVNL